MKIEHGYDFDDLLLVPQPSSVNSRDEVDLSVQLPNIKLHIPIILSPMKGISNPILISWVDELGGLGMLHRFYDYETEDIWYKDVTLLYNTCQNWGVAIGLEPKSGRYKYALDKGAKVICIDVANGYLETVRSFTKEVVNDARQYNALVMVGNVVTPDGSRNLGANLVRVGIGSGGLCTTREVTGVGYPQLSALSTCRESLQFTPKKIVSDGGIRNSGDAVKALAAGADLVMMGSLFGQCFESDHDGEIYGMASEKLQEEYYHTTKSIEGISKVIQKTMPVEKFIRRFIDGMKSAFTYMNARNIKELQKNAKWVQVTRC